MTIEATGVDDEWDRFFKRYANSDSTVWNQHAVSLFRESRSRVEFGFRKEIGRQWRSFWRGVDKTAGKVSDFVVEHKDQILIGAAVVASAAVVVVLSGGIAAQAAIVASCAILNQLGDASSEPPWEPTNQSQNFQIHGPSLKHGKIGTIFGINTSQSENEAYARKLSSLAKNVELDCTYNASHSILTGVVESVFLNYEGYSAPAKLLIESWSNFAKKHQHNPKAKYFQICHSQGAIHVKNALELCPEALRKKIIVLAIAPGEIVPKALCHNSYNYVSRRDLVPYGKWIAQGLTEPGNDQRNLQNIAALEELVILDSHSDAPLFDHSFESLTFKAVIKTHIEEYLEEYRG